MTRMIPTIRFLLWITAAVYVAGTPWHAKADRADDLVIGISQFPGAFNPNINSHLAKTYIQAMARRPITAYDPDWKLVCLLCTELPTKANSRVKEEISSEGKPAFAVTFTLDERASWGDGTPLTTRDVVFTWEVGRHPLSGVTSLEFFKRILSIDAHDDKTFTLHLDRKSCDYADISGFQLLPEHLERDVFEEAPDQYRHKSIFETDVTNPGLWFGPYRIADVVSGARVVLERNPHWWGKKPNFDRVIVTVINNTAGMTSNLLAGGVDMIAGEIGLTLDQGLALRDRYPDRFTYIFKPSLVYEHVDINLENPKLQDPRVRHALLLGVDRDAISQHLFGGFQPVAHSNVNPLDSTFDPKVPKTAYDPDQARALLEEAGWRPGEDGFRYNAEGQRLRMEIMTTSGNRTRELIQQVLQSQWREIGIDLRIRNQPARVLFGQTVSKRQFSDMVMYAWLSSPGSTPRSQLHSDMIPTEENGRTGQNFMGYRNPEMDDILDRMEVECDAPTQATLWSRLQHLYATDLPVLPLYFRANSYILAPWLRGLRPTGHQYSSTLWVEDWYRADAETAGAN